MNREKFMRELEYLLQDIREEDKADALAYYRDYLEEAGDDEEEAIRGFGSPERIAAIIRADIAGHLAEGGAFTERGYEDERFRDPNHQMVKRYDLPEAGEEIYRGNQENGWEQHEKPRRQPSNILLWGIILLITSPIWLGLGGGLLGVLAGLLVAFITLMGAVGILAVAFFIAGIACIVVGTIFMATNLLGGLLSVGIGCILLGLGFLGMVVSVQIFGRLIPWMIRGTVDFISNLIQRRGGRA